jgi:hypothetical protein
MLAICNLQTLALSARVRSEHPSPLTHVPAVHVLARKHNAARLR